MKSVASHACPNASSLQLTIEKGKQLTVGKDNVKDNVKDNDNDDDHRPSLSLSGIPGLCNVTRPRFMN